MQNLLGKAVNTVFRRGTTDKRKEYQLAQTASHSQLDTQSELLLEQGYRETNYFAKTEDNPDRILRNGPHLDSVLGTINEQFDEDFFNDLKNQFESVVVVGIVTDKETDEFDKVVSVDIFDPREVSIVQSNVSNNRRRFTTTKVFVKDRKSS